MGLLNISEKKKIEDFFKGSTGEGLSQTAIISIIHSKQVNKFIEYMRKYGYRLRVVKNSDIVV